MQACRPPAGRIAQKDRRISLRQSSVSFSYISAKIQKQQPHMAGADMQTNISVRHIPVSPACTEAVWARLFRHTAHHHCSGSVYTVFSLELPHGNPFSP